LEDLPLPAQLNCAADKLADDYLVQYPGVYHSWVPLLPTTGCQLHLPQGTVTYDYKRALALARRAPPMRDKLCHKHNWSREDFDSVDWTAHGRALHSLIKHKSTLIKYLNDMLPVGKLVNTYNPKYPASCPSCCPEILETREHLWECIAPAKQTWRKQCLPKQAHSSNW
jgi:hypothetical protein